MKTLSFVKSPGFVSRSKTKFHCPSNHWYLTYQHMNNEYRNLLIHASSRKSKFTTNFYHFIAKMAFVVLFSKLWSHLLHEISLPRSKSTNKTTGTAYRQCWNLQVIFFRLPPITASSIILQSKQRGWLTLRCTKKYTKSMKLKR